MWLRKDCQPSKLASKGVNQADVGKYCHLGTVDWLFRNQAEAAPPRFLGWANDGHQECYLRISQLQFFAEGLLALSTVLLLAEVSQSWMDPCCYYLVYFHHLPCFDPFAASGFAGDEWLFVQPKADVPAKKKRNYLIAFLCCLL